MTAGFFITGTDTGVGKTTIALGLIDAFQKTGRKVAVMKPLSAGCEVTKDGLRNEDAVLMMKQSSTELPYETVNPYAFEPPIAPHIAAEQARVNIDSKLLLDRYQQISDGADMVIVEGAGGWLVPVDDHQTMADIAIAMDLPVILVVGMRLGCLNHALLTQSSIKQMKLKIAGWVANSITPDFPFAAENQQTLEKRLDSPLLGSIPYLKQQKPADISNYIDISKLL